MTPEISELDAIAAIIRVAYEEQLPTINGDSCFERIAAERVLAHISERTDAGWQPIETAPRDYTPVLAIENFTRVDDNDLPYPPEQMVVQWSKTAERWASFGVIVDSFQPTHWRPLPAPPPEEASNG